MIKWLERNVISITIMSFFAGILVVLIYTVIEHVILEFLYWCLFGVAALGTILQIIWAWIINPIRAYRKNKKL